MKKLLAIAALCLFGLPAFAQVTISVNPPNYGWQVMTGAERELAAYPTGAGATTKLVNWSVVSGSATLSCTSSCADLTKVTITATGGTCTVGGTVGAYTLSSTSDIVIRATSVDDPTKHDDVTFHVCATTVDVKIVPFYQQAYKSQDVTLQSYATGAIPGDVTWSITSTPSGGNGTLADTGNQDTVFHSGTVTGRYGITATSVDDPTKSYTATVYVATTSLPTIVNKVRPTPCEVDPALTGTDYEVGPSKAFHDLTALPLPMNAGSIERIYNETVGTGTPTTYTNIQVVEGSSSASATQPIWICGVANAAGVLPRIDGSGATQNASNPLSLQGLAAFILFQNNPFHDGYNLPSAGPDFVGITGLNIVRFNTAYQYNAVGGGLTNYTSASAFWQFAGNHHVFIGNDLNDVQQGILAKNSTFNSGTTFTQFLYWGGNNIENFGFNTNSGYHGGYFQGQFTVVEGNRYAYPQPGNNADFIKMRGSDSIIRYNSFIGAIGFHVIEYPLLTDSCAYESADCLLGTPGDTTCADSTWCTITTNQITMSQLTINSQSLTVDRLYGNILSNKYGSQAAPTVQYGSYSGGNECGAPCSNMVDRNGRLYSYSNTFDEGSQTYQTANPYAPSNNAAAQFARTTILSANNIDWIDPDHFGNPTAGGAQPGNYGLSMDSTIIIDFLTNLYQTSSVVETGTINGGDPITGITVNGWGSYTNAFAYPLSQPMNGHMTGLNSTQFKFTTGIPFNRYTFSPIPGSPAIGAATTLTDPMIATSPLRFQPDRDKGWLTVRAHPTTLGAVDEGLAQPTYTMSLTPSSVTQTYPPGSAVAFTESTTFSSPAVSEDDTHRVAWTSTTPSSFGYFSVPNLFSTASPFAAGSGFITATMDGNTGTSPFLLGSGPATVATPTYTPPAGTFGAAQSIVIANSTSGSSNVITNDGTTPTVTSLTCTITNGTLYTGAVSVPTSQTLKAIGCKSGDNASTVATAPYVITPTVVSIATLPSGASIGIGSTQAYTCTATLSDSTTEPCSTAGTVAWASGTPGHATINSSTGVATGVAAGTTAITATVVSITSPSQTLTVTASGSTTITGSGIGIIGSINIYR